MRVILPPSSSRSPHTRGQPFLGSKWTRRHRLKRDRPMPDSRARRIVYRAAGRLRKRRRGRGTGSHFVQQRERKFLYSVTLLELLRFPALPRLLNQGVAFGQQKRMGACESGKGVQIRRAASASVGHHQGIRMSAREAERRGHALTTPEASRANRARRPASFEKRGSALKCVKVAPTIGRGVKCP